MTENFFIGAYWKEDFSTTEIYLDKCWTLLYDLKDLLKEYCDIKIVSEKSELIQLPSSEFLFQQVMLPLIQNEDAWYTAPNGEKATKISLKSVCDSGFFSEYIFEGKTDLFHLSVFAGLHKNLSLKSHESGNSIPNSVVISFPQEMVEFEKEISLINELIQKVNSCWNPDYSVFTSSLFAENFKSVDSNINLGWLTYFKFDDTLQVPSEKLTSQRINNGVLLSLVKPKFESNSETDLQNGIELKEILKKYDLLRL